MTGTKSESNRAGRWLAIGVMGTLCLCGPAQARPPGWEVMAQDFQTTCRAEVDRVPWIGESPSVGTFQELVSRRIEDQGVDALASADEMRAFHADMVRSYREGMEGESDSSWHTDRIALLDCALRVGLRHAPASQPAAQIDSRPSTPPAQQEAAEMAVSLQDFRRTCARELTSWGAPTDSFYPAFASRDGLPGGNSQDLASPDELQRKYADLMREFQRLSALLPEGRVAAGTALNACMLRVALRHARSGGTAASASAATLAPPAIGVRDALAAFNAGNRVEAVRQWRLLADGGDRDAAYYLGVAYTLGFEDITLDPVLANHYYALSANAGLPKAQANYGLFLLQTGRPEDGRRWIERATASGDAEAQWVVGSGYWRGRGLERDLARAHALMRLSAAQNFAEAVRDLALLEVGLSAAAESQTATQPVASTPNPSASTVSASPPARNRQPNPTGLTEAMIEPCREWTSINNTLDAARRARRDPTSVAMSNLDFVLTRAPFKASNGRDETLSLAETMPRWAEWNRIVLVMERRDVDEMPGTVGRVYTGREYWPRLAFDEEFLCLLDVRRKQLTGTAFNRPVPTPASLGFPGF